MPVLERTHAEPVRSDVRGVGLFVCAAGMMYLMTSAKDSFDIILQVGAGTGLLYILRWFWWRINAWCEVVAMVSSFLISIAFFVLEKSSHHFASSTKLILTILFTTLCWVVAAYVAPATDHETLRNFYRKVSGRRCSRSATCSTAARVTRSCALRSSRSPASRWCAWSRGCGRRRRSPDAAPVDGAR